MIIIFNVSLKNIHRTQWRMPLCKTQMHAYSGETCFISGGGGGVKKLLSSATT
jgi:hypothetical protein